MRIRLLGDRMPHMHRRSFFAMLAAPFLARFMPKVEPEYFPPAPAQPQWWYIPPNPADYYQVGTGWMTPGDTFTISSAFDSPMASYYVTEVHSNNNMVTFTCQPS